MFERFTERARRAVVMAQEEARRLRHNYIGTEHLLLGVLRLGEGTAFRALQEVGAGLEETRATVIEIVGLGAESPSGHIPFTPRAKSALEQSLRQSLQLGHNFIGTEHILLALAGQDDGTALDVLEHRQVDTAGLRQRVIEALSEGGDESPARRRRQGRRRRSPKPAGMPIELAAFGAWLREALGHSAPRFSDEAIAVLHEAPTRAELIGSDHVGSEHVLLALASRREEAPAQVMEQLGIAPDRLVAEAARAAGAQSATPPGRLVISQGLVDLLAFALFEAEKDGAQQVAPEHLLLGVLWDQAGIGAQVLGELGGGLESVRDTVRRVAGTTDELS